MSCPDAQLLSCPFCGGDAESDSQQAYRNISSGEFERAVAVYCRECSAAIAMCKGDVPEASVEMVAEMWNRRARSTSGKSYEIPSLAKWLGDGSRGDGFEEFVAEVLKQERSLDPGVAASHRIIKTLMIALIEAARIEDAADLDPVDTLMRMGRGLGFSFIAAMMSRGREDTPLDEAASVAGRLVREGIEQFVAAEKLADAVSEKS